MGKYKVVVVDDSKVSRLFIGKLINNYPEYVVEEMSSGEEFIEKFDNLRKSPPDIFVLDIVMKKISGFDVAHQLKIDSTLKHIPILFLSGSSDIDDKLEAFEKGGADYVTKPFNKNELMARIQTHVKLKVLHESLESKNVELAKSNRAQQASLKIIKETQAKLLNAEKLASLGSLTVGFSHELNTPVGIGLMAISSFSEQAKSMKVQLNSNSLKKSEFESFIHASEEVSGLVERNLQKMAAIIDDFKSLNTDQFNHSLEVLDMSTLLGNVEDKYLNHKKATLQVTCEKVCNIQGYASVFEEIFGNIIDNAIIHGFSNKDKGVIFIALTRIKDELVIWVKDDGEGMSSDVMSKIFDPFFTTKRNLGKGMGMYRVYNFVTKLLHGRIECSSSTGKGCEINIHIPLESLSKENLDSKSLSSC
jgi:signal transduction histidine kinase